MKIIVSILTILVFTSCLKSSKDLSRESNQTDSQNIVIDTLLVKLGTAIVMDKAVLTNGIENEVKISLDSIEAKDIVVYTSISEATVKLGKQAGYYAITPKLGADQVGITLNYHGSEGLRKLGRVTIKTTPR
jgi:hypothetical protein